MDYYMDYGIETFHTCYLYCQNALHNHALSHAVCQYSNINLDYNKYIITYCNYYKI